jgi:putative ABC transport system substrate-binding protein
MTAPLQRPGRRALLAALGGAAGWVRAPRAHAQPVPAIGFLRDASFDGTADLVAAFQAGLAEAGYVGGQNVAIEFSSAEGNNERVSSLVADLVRRPVAVIFANGPALLAAKATTATIPIVFATGSDPVREGYVASFNRPGGNVTGVTFLSNTLQTKQLELLRELMPGAATVALLVDASNPSSVIADASAGAAALGFRVVAASAGSARDIDAAFSTFAQQRVAAVLVVGAGFFFSRHQQIVSLAMQHALPAIYENRAYVADGGLMSYSSSITEAYRLAGSYVGRILRGASPGDLPVIRGTRFDLTINLRTARSLGLTFPPTLLARADEVIE